MTRRSAPRPTGALWASKSAYGAICQTRFAAPSSSLAPEKKAPPTNGWSLFLSLAERTGLEPATPGVTGRYSNQLNYRSESGGC